LKILEKQKILMHKEYKLGYQKMFQPLYRNNS